MTEECVWLKKGATLFASMHRRCGERKRPLRNEFKIVDELLFVAADNGVLTIE